MTKLSVSTGRGGACGGRGFFQSVTGQAVYLLNMKV